VSALLAIGASVLAPLGYWATLAAVNGRRRSGEPPLVRGALPFLGVAVPFGKDSTSFVQRCRAEVGDVFTLFIAGQRMTFVLDPLSAPAVLKAKQLAFHPISGGVLTDVFKVRSLHENVDLEAMEALGRSRLRGDALTSLTQTMATQLRRQMPTAISDRWEERPLYRLVWDIMFAAGTEALLGQGVVSEQLAADFEVFDRYFPLMFAGLPRPLIKDGDAALDRLSQTPLPGKNPADWIRDRQPLLQRLPPHEQGLARVPILWAINANTIPAAFWSVYYLLRDPQGLAAVMDELDALSEHERSELSVRTLDGLHMLDSAIREALRLSSGSLTVREVLEPFALETLAGTHSLRRGDRVCLAPFITHRDPDIFEQPLEYRADRFYSTSGRKQFYKNGQRVPLPLMPFGAGVSMCPGRFFAMNEIKLFVAMALSQWELQADSGPIPDFEFSRAGIGIYPPAHDVQVRIRRKV
jgi:cytochrome P450